MALVQRKSKKHGIRYEVRVRDSIGDWFPSKTFDRKVDAAKYERDLLSQKDRGKASPNKQRLKVTFSDYWILWARECRSETSDGWKYSQDQMVRDYILPTLGCHRLIDISLSNIRQILNEVKELGRKPQTLLHIYNLLHKMFEDAIDDEIISDNPVRKKLRPKLRKVERNYLNPAEYWKLERVSRDHFVYPAIRLCGESGLRISEVQGLACDGLDFRNGRLIIKQIYNRKEKRLQPFPKSKDWGEAPIPQNLIELLKKLTSGKSEKSFVAGGPDGSMLNYHTFYFALKRLCKKAGVINITPHEIRHSSSELYIEAGASAEDIRRLLNHKSLSVTSRYIHRSNGRLQKIASRIKSDQPF